jgi:molybdopterin-guanine dinucleotide biosynthesis protein A
MGPYPDAMRGVLLTGGASSRMGTPKAAIPFGGRTLGRRAADALREVTEQAVAVGPAFDTDLRTVEDPREGPLVAFVCGATADDPTFLVACDIPFLGAGALRSLARQLGPHDAVVPVVDGRDQPSVSLWSPHAVDVAREAVAKGERRLMAVIRRLDVRRVEDETLFDVDTPDDLARAGALLLERRARIARRRDAGAEERELRADAAEQAEQRAGLPRPLAAGERQHTPDDRRDLRGLP